MSKSLDNIYSHPMGLDDFRKFGYELIDLIADYHEKIPGPVAPFNLPVGALLNKLPKTMPGSPEAFEDIIEDVSKKVMPALTHWISPSFFAYFPCNSSLPAILGELVSAGLSQQGMMWITSPACTELEMRTVDWLAHALNLPGEFTHDSGKGGGVIQGSASEAILAALVAARDRTRKRQKSVENISSMDARMVVYGSDQTHSSLLKACKIAGFHESQVRLIKTQNGAMQFTELKSVLEADLASGKIPVFVCGTVGTTGNGAVDPICEIGELCAKYNIWFHVDAAWAGSAGICPEIRPMLNGVELADSFCLNPHKWLLVTFDCNVFFVRDKKVLVDALSVTPEYLRNKATSSGNVIDFRDWQIPLGRRLRALKLWFVLRTYGLSKLQEFIRHGVNLAEQFEKWVLSCERLELCCSRSLSLVCFRVIEGNEKTELLMQRLNESGKVFLTHTVLEGKLLLRASFGGQYTQKEHVENLQKEITQELKLI